MVNVIVGSDGAAAAVYAIITQTQNHFQSLSALNRMVHEAQRGHARDQIGKVGVVR